MAPLPDYLTKSLELLANAQTMQDYLDILLILNVGAKLKNELAQSADIKRRILAVIDELKTLEQIVITCGLCGQDITNITGGYQHECDGGTMEIWPPNLDGPEPQ